MGTRRIRTWATLVVTALAAAVVAVAAVPAGTPAGADVNDAPGSPPAFARISAGLGRTCAVMTDGRVKCWGDGVGGVLGNGDNTTRGDGANEMGDNLPAVDLGTGRTATAVAMGTNHACALLDDATVKCWGLGIYLGQGDTLTRGDGAGEMGDNLPAIDLGVGRTATAISAGDQMTCAILDNALVKCWGFNGSGQLGVGDTATRGDGPGEMGNALPTVNLGAGRTAVALSSGGDHTCAILDNAAVKCWGDNVNGQLGLGDTADRGDNGGEMGDTLPAVALGTGRTAVALSSGYTHTCAVLDDATLKCWGSNSNGKLGIGDITNRGDNGGEMGDSLPAVALGTGRSVVAVSSGASHTCAVLDNGSVKCWGFNTTGALGLGDLQSRGDQSNEMGDNLPAVDLGAGRSASAMTAGGNFACALLDDATYKCWGQGASGRLGIGDINNRGDGAGEMGDNLPAVDLGQGHAVQRVTSGANHSCAILDDGTVKCWGGNANGQLGLGDVTSRGFGPDQMADALLSVDLGNGRTAVAVDSSSNHTCAILDNGKVKCWGLNIDGQLGLGDTVNRGDGPGEMGASLPSVSLGAGRTAVALAVGNSHTCAVLDDATVKCWGRNDSGQLGLGDVLPRGDGAGEMGGNLPTVALGAGRTAVAISAGDLHTCAVLDNAKVKCWGLNSIGQLGQGDTTSRGDGPTEMGGNLPAIDLGTGRTATAITSGTAFNCAILDDQTVKCWGSGGTGRLGTGDGLARGDGAGEMGNNLPTVDLGTGRTVSGVDSGFTHTCAVLDDATVKCWGVNTLGPLGLGDTAHRGDGPGEMGNNLPAVDLGTGRTATLVTGGGSVSCTILDTEQVKCWGANSGGQLGLGGIGNRGDGAGEMGNDLPFVQLTGVGEGTISGTITDAVSAAAVPGAFVAVMRVSDFVLVGGATADAGGNFSVDVRAGAYYLYLIDPAGLHVAGFAGPPTRATVLDGATSDLDATMAPTQGSVTGTITRDGGAPAIGGAWALSASMVNGAPERGAVANGAGVYTIPGLSAATHSIVHIDPTGAHAPEYVGGSSAFPGTPATVTAGVATTANGTLPSQTAIPGGANLTGTVTQAGTGTGLSGVWVLALRASDFAFARGALTTAGGAYTLNVQAGQYKLAFIDPNGAHAMEWFNDQPYTALATATSVTSPSVNNASVTRTTGGFSGTVTDQVSGAPLPGIFVVAIDATGSLLGGQTTDASGNYAFATLPTGAYRVAFIDPTGDHALEYWNDSPDYAGGDDVTVTPASNLDVDAALD